MTSEEALQRGLERLRCAEAERLRALGEFILTGEPAHVPSAEWLDEAELEQILSRLDGAPATVPPEPPADRPGRWPLVAALAVALAPLVLSWGLAALEAVGAR